MPVYEYFAIDEQGKKVKGSLDAENVRVARQKLRSQRIFTTDIHEGVEKRKGTTRDISKYFQSNRIGSGELAVLTRQLATLVGAGLPLVSALAALSDQTDSPVLKRIVVKVKETVEEGSSLAKAFGEYPKSFPRLYVNLVASGEESGTLDSVLTNLADYLDSQLELQRKIISALVYPALMLVICVLVISGLIIFVVPQIVGIFKKQGAALPIPTRIMVALSNFLSSYWIIIALVLIGLVMGIRSYWRTVEGRKKIDEIILKLPIYGKIYTKIATARVTNTLSTLLSSGVDLLVGLDISKNIISNVHLVKALEDAKEGVREGKSLAGEIGRSGLFPSMVSHMIAVGEKSGELESMLQKTSKAYEREVNATLSGLTSLIEPLMMIFVGVVVLGIVISVLLPMTDLMNQLQHG